MGYNHDNAYALLNQGDRITIFRGVTIYNRDSDVSGFVVDKCGRSKKWVLVTIKNTRLHLTQAHKKGVHFRVDRYASRELRIATQKYQYQYKGRDKDGKPITVWKTSLFWVRCDNNGDPWGMFVYALDHKQARYLAKDFYDVDVPAYEDTKAYKVIRGVWSDSVGVGVDDDADEVIKRHGLFGVWEDGFLKAWFKTEKEREDYLKEDKE